MLKSTDNTFTREQFVMLRKARALIEEQFQTQFSLHSENVIADVYSYAVRSESNELFRLFTDLNELSGNALAQPLNEEQFILLRQAKHLIQSEFAQALALCDPEVTDHLFDFAIRSTQEALFDIYRYLLTRDREQVDVRATGAYFLAIRSVLELAHEEFGDELPATHAELVALLPSFAEKSNQERLVTAIARAKQPEQSKLGTDLVFTELSAPEFERLRDAKNAIRDEFAEDFSLHRPTTLDDLYAFALQSEETLLFDLFCDLQSSQVIARKDAAPPKDWIDRDQFKVLCAARAAIQSEFGETLQLRSAKVQSDLYEYSLQAEDESLFALCRDYHDLCAPEDRTVALPSKSEFNLLRRARKLVSEEFSEALTLEAGVVEYDLYLYAVRSEQDALFDLYAELMELPDKLETTAFDEVTLLLTKEEYVALRTARRSIRDEFGEVLALESETILDDLYRYALDSKTETLFDIHAELNARAVTVEHIDVQSDSTPESVSDVITELEQDDQSKSDQAKTEQPTDEQAPSGLGRFFRLFSSTPTPEPDSNASKSALASASAKDNDDLPSAPDPQSQTAKQALDIILPEPEVEEISMDAADMDASADEDGPKLDMITRAMMQKKNGAARNDPTQASPDTRSQLNSGQNSGTKKKRSISLPPVASQTHSDIDWYITTSDEQFRIRIINEINLSTDGELLLVIDESEPLGAIIQIDAQGPLLLPKIEGIQVNDEPANANHRLENGDVIAIGGKVLRLEGSSEANASTTASL